MTHPLPTPQPCNLGADAIARLAAEERALATAIFDRRCGGQPTAFLQSYALTNVALSHHRIDRHTWDKRDDHTLAVSIQNGHAQSFTSPILMLFGDDFAHAVNLGHFLLHYALPVRNGTLDPAAPFAIPAFAHVREPSLRPLCDEARLFAKELLMPEAVVREAYVAGGFEEVRRRMDLPFTVAQQRIRALGLDTVSA